MKAFGNSLLIASLLMAGGWVWLTSALHQQASITAWLMAGVIVVVGIALRYFFAFSGKA